MTRFAIVELFKNQVPLWLTEIRDDGWQFSDNKAVTFESYVDAYQVVKKLVARGHKDPLHIVTTPAFFRGPSLGPKHWRARKRKAPDWMEALIPTRHVRDSDTCGECGVPIWPGGTGGDTEGRCAQHRDVPVGGAL